MAPIVTFIQIWHSKAVGMGIVQLKNGTLQYLASKCGNEVPEKMV
jgi:CRISPR/Cas system CSM-associated protein Csm3 (group 7 of RAMP superfamily)